MKFHSLPKELYSYPGVKKILYNNDSCILHKVLYEDLLKQQKIATSHCIVLIKKGKLEIKTVEGVTITISENEMVFMPRDTYLLSDFVKHEDCIDLHLVYFDHNIILKFLSLKEKHLTQVSNIKPTVTQLKADKKILQYFDSLNEIYADLDNDRSILELKILEFLHLVYLNNQNQIIDTLNSSEEQKRRRNIASMMLDNYDKNLTVTDFANLSGRSLSTFNRDFKRMYRQTPKQWLIKKKMEKAIELLADGSSVTNCAFSIGYNNVSHFIKAYKSIYGTTPKSQ